MAPTKWVCFEPTVWSDTCCSVHRNGVSLHCSYKYGHACRIECSHTCLRCVPRQMLVCCVVCRFWLRCSSAAPRLLGLRIRIPSGAWMSASFECCMLLGRCLCIGLITRPEESYRMWCVWMWLWILENEEALVHKALLLYDNKNYEHCYVLCQKGVRCS